MERITTLIALFSFSLCMVAQGVDELLVMSKMTEKEKEDAKNARLMSCSPSTQHYGFDLDVDDGSLGWGINYSKHFQLALNSNYTYSYLSIIGEYGFRLKNIISTNEEQVEPKWYCSIAPGIYFKYFSINCGLGIASEKEWLRTYEATNYSSDYHNKNLETNNNVDIYGSSIKSKRKYGFLLKPSISGYIPTFDEDYYISINIGYLYLPKLKELNGFSFGVGVQRIFY